MEYMLYHALQRPMAFFAHVWLAPLVLFLLPFQLWTALRLRRPHLHRWLGYISAVAILISGVGGLLLAIGTESGLVAGLGFGLLAVVWIGITARAVWLARQKRLVAHRDWMIRSASLTLAGVTLRLYLPIIPLAGLQFEPAYTAIAWVSWVPNLLLAELWLRRKRGRAAG
ncbi:DUF2306 domain-containing protein [Phaeobacter sp. C3_T13_0]|uniref:DUF2306 domain-containing protein n=1 Tax=Phaeobacter cretensis TaxID=3342641 RepID=UPI0039BD5E2C